MKAGPSGDERQVDAEDLFRRFKDPVFRLIRRTVFDRQAQEDLFQETFVNLVRALPSFSARSRLSTWVYSVTLHTCFNHFRRQRRLRSVSLDEWLDERGGEVADPAVRPDAAQAVELGCLLDGALRRLPLRYRLPIHLYYVEGAAYREIARALDMPMGTVKTNLYRGLRRLRQILGGTLDDYL